MWKTPGPSPINNLPGRWWKRCGGWEWPQEASGRNDILVEGRKVSGTAQRLLGKRILHHGTLLFDSDPEMIAGGAAGGRLQISIQKHEVCALPRGEYPGISADGYDAARLLGVSEGFPGGEALQSGSLTEAEHQQVLLIESGEVRRLGVDLRPDAPVSFANRHRWDGGLLEVRVQAENGRITAARFYGDFLSLCPPAPLEAALRGVFSSARMWRRR